MNTTNNSKQTARKTKLDKYDFNPDDNLQRRKKLQRLMKQGHLAKEQIQIGQSQFDQIRELGPCSANYQNYKQCLMSNAFSLSKCLNAQLQITKCQNQKGLIQQSVQNALEILKTRKINEWTKQ